MIPYIAYMDPMGLSDCCFMPRRETDQFLVPLFFVTISMARKIPKARVLNQWKLPKTLFVCPIFFIIPPKMFRFSWKTDWISSISLTSLTFSAKKQWLKFPHPAPGQDQRNELLVPAITSRWREFPSCGSDLVHFCVKNRRLHSAIKKRQTKSYHMLEFDGHIFSWWLLLMAILFF